MKRLAGYCLMIAAWMVLTPLLIPAPLFSWQNLQAIVAVTMFALATNVLDAADAGRWPWERS